MRIGHHIRRLRSRIGTRLLDFHDAISTGNACHYVYLSVKQYSSEIVNVSTQSEGDADYPSALSLALENITANCTGKAKDEDDRHNTALVHLSLKILPDFHFNKRLEGAHSRLRTIVGIQMQLDCHASSASSAQLCEVCLTTNSARIYSGINGRPVGCSSRQLTNVALPRTKRKYLVVSLDTLLSSRIVQGVGSTRYLHTRSQSKRSSPPLTAAAAIM